MAVVRVALLVLALAAAGLAFTAQPAECVWCADVRCYGSCLGDRCVCVTPPGSTSGGRCYGVE